MKIAITANGPNLETVIDPRFGRAPYFLIVDGQSGELLETVDNGAGVSASQGAGIAAASLIAVKGVSVLLTGRVGPKAMPILTTAGIKVIEGVGGSVKEVIANYPQQGLASPQTATDNPSRADSLPSLQTGSGCLGDGAGRCQIGGGGGGRGQGKGRGAGQCRR